MGAVPVLTRLAHVAGLVCLCGVVDGPRAESSCRTAFAARDWPAALEACGPESGDDGRVRHAWAQLYSGHNEEALAEAAELFDSSERAEARYLGGLILTRRPDRVEEGRRLMEGALELFAAAAEAQRAADIASTLVPVVLHQRRFDDALAYARRAVELADATAEPGRRGA
ncbi:MAG: hypothetical protein KIT31_32030, partial [Deltaproteobacteria bacterium]|nr:hypothetical protein [Deltaproteobacteria bacterium]